MDLQECGGEGEPCGRTAARVLRRLAGQGDEADDGSPHLGAQDRGDHFDRGEERSAFRRRTPETASRLSVSGPESASSWRSWEAVISVGFLRRTGSRESIHRLPRPGVPSAPSLRVNSMPPRMTEESYRLQVSDRTMVGTLNDRHACQFQEPKGTVAARDEITGGKGASRLPAR
jgi:hypothetical protein